MKLSVVIVNYNVKYYLAQCLHSLKHALKGIDAEVIVVDNASVDGSVDYLKQVHPWVRYVASDTNLGFSKANNLAIRQSQGEYVLLLNPDTVVGENVLTDALAFMDEHPQSGGVGVRMLNSDGTEAMESRRGIPTPAVAFWKMAGLCRRFPTSRRFARYYMSWLPWDRPARIEIMSGAFCLMRKRALDEVGLLDEDFFMYGEDIDLSYRILKGGWENWYLPLRILHYKGESTQKSSFRYVTVFYKAMLIFVRKHFRHFSRLMSTPLQMAIYLKATCSIMGVQWEKWCCKMHLVKPVVKEKPLFVFHISDAHKDRCLRLVEKNGLQAVFESADSWKERGGAKEGKGAKNAPEAVYQVFDMSQYQYADLFSHFSATFGGRCLIAFWYPEENRLVTNSQVHMG